MGRQPIIGECDVLRESVISNAQDVSRFTIGPNRCRRAKIDRRLPAA